MSLSTQCRRPNLSSYFINAEAAATTAPVSFLLQSDVSQIEEIFNRTRRKIIDHKNYVLLFQFGQLFPSKLCVKLGGRSNKTQLDQFKIEMFRGEGKYTKLDKERET